MKITKINRDQMKELKIDSDGIIHQFKSIEQAEAFNKVAELIHSKPLELSRAVALEVESELNKSIEKIFQEFL